MAKQKGIGTPPSEQVILQRQQIQAHAGPLPPPEMLRRYDEIVPGAAERILAMAEQLANHRQALQRQELASGIEARANEQALEKRGQWFAGLLGFAALCGAVTCTLYGHDAVGGTIVGTTILAILGAYLGTRKPVHDEKRARD